MKRKGTALLLAAALLWTLGISAMGAWYDDAVLTVTDWGLMTGTGRGFEPEGLVNRAMMFQTLYNREGKPETPAPTEHLLQMNESVSGISGYWWTDAARWAYAQGLTTGDGNGFFDGDRVATRSEIVTILYRYAQMTGMDVSVGEETNILTYEDAENVPAWAVPAFQWAVGAGVVSGKGGVLLAPNDSATRAELAQILCNYEVCVGPDVVLTGQAASINKYGDVVTTITAEELYAAGVLPGDVLKVTVGDKSLNAPWVTHYDDVAQGQPLVLVEEALRLCLSRGDFATAYAVGSRGDSAVYELTPTAISVAMPTAGGTGVEPLGLGDKLSLDRADYDSDETFANFRGVSVGKIAPGVLYRSASPIETVAGRNIYADSLLGQAGVKTIVDMADCRAKAPKYDTFAGTNYEKVHQDDGVVYLNMGSDMYVQVGLDDLRNGLDFMTERPGPYLIHSTYGADRAGHLVFLLEALMGADVDDIVDDYMASFENLYHIERGSEEWAELARGGIEADILRLLEVSDMDAARDLARSKTATGATMLEQAAERYLVDKVGLTTQQVETLRDHLSTPLKG